MRYGAESPRTVKLGPHARLRAGRQLARTALQPLRFKALSRSRLRPAICRICVGIGGERVAG